MRQAIIDFPKQFSFSPIVENEQMLVEKPCALVCGMGGSHLPADILKTIDSNIDLAIHSNYGLPFLCASRFEELLFVASSYSGNTEETLDAYDTVGANGMARAVIATGGKLLEVAKRDGVPYIQMPNTGVQPRSALGFGIVALTKLLGRNELLSSFSRLSDSLKPLVLENAGRELAEKLKGTTSVIYSSASNEAIAKNWKIKMNETGKSPSFCNVFPELNHNEMTGFDVHSNSAPPSSSFSFVFLKDELDNERVQRRMEITAKLFRDRGFAVHEIEFEGANRIEQIFNSLILADWTALATAEIYGLEPEQVPMVEELKKLI
jgi:glucose/mannose-6-phosphate isomerase